MARSFLTLLNILLALNGILAMEQQTRLEFTHIGKLFISESSTRNDYYASPTSVQWTVAMQNCQSYFGSNAYLLFVETEAEWNFLKETKEWSSFGTEFWTDGMNDSERNVWKWSLTHEPIQSFATWAPGYPTNSPSAMHRIILNHIGQYSASLSTGYNSASKRYVCKVVKKIMKTALV